MALLFLVPVLYAQEDGRLPADMACIGIVSGHLTDPEIAAMGIGCHGHLIHCVLPGYPAAKVGITVGDIITKFDGNKEIERTDQLIDFLKTKESGDNVVLTVLRKNKEYEEKEFEISLVKRGDKYDELARSQNVPFVNDAYSKALVWSKERIVCSEDQIKDAMHDFILGLQIKCDESKNEEYVAELTHKIDKLTKDSGSAIYKEAMNVLTDLAFSEEGDSLQK